MSIAAEMDLSFGRGVTTEHILHGSVTEEQRRPKRKDTQPEGFAQKEAASVVARRSQIHEGYAPSSRLAGRLFLREPFGLSVFALWPSLFLRHRSMKDMLRRHASAKTQIHLSGNTHSFLTGC